MTAQTPVSSSAHANGFGQSARSGRVEAVLWSSPEGQLRLANATHGRGFARLAPYWQPQVFPYTCALASGVAALNALRMPQGAAPRQPELEENELNAPLDYAAYSQLTLLYEETDVIKGRKEVVWGLTLEELEGVLRHYGLAVERRHASTKKGPGDVDSFRDDVRRALGGESEFILCNYFGKAMGVPVGGHFSPLGAYDDVTDSVLVLDVALHRTPWYWMPVADFHAAMTAVDKESERERGWLVVSEG